MTSATYTCRTCNQALSSAGSTDRPDAVVFFHSGAADHAADPVRFHEIASDFKVGDIVNVASWGSTEFRVTGHSRLRDMSDIFHIYVDVATVDSGLTGHELPESLTKVR